MTFLKNFVKEQAGQDLIEYSLLLGFIALFSVGLYQAISGNINTIWNNASSQLATAAS